MPVKFESYFSNAFKIRSIPLGIGSLTCFFFTSYGIFLLFMHPDKANR